MKAFWYFQIVLNFGMAAIATYIWQSTGEQGNALHYQLAFLISVAVVTLTPPTTTEEG